MALTAVDKCISYGLIKVGGPTAAACVQQIADSITHARFVGTDSASDEVVLMKILHVSWQLHFSTQRCSITFKNVISFCDYNYFIK